MPDTIVASPTRITFPVDGMHCAGCVGRIERAIAAVPGVSTATVNLATRQATVESEQPVPMAALAEAVARAGYSVPASPDPITTTLELDGLTCAGCVGRTERALLAVEGVTEATVNLATRRATVRHGADTTADALATAVRAAGYDAFPLAPSAIRAGPERPVAAQAGNPDREAKSLRRRALLAAILAAPLLLLEMGGHLLPPLHHAVVSVLGDAGWRWTQFGIASAALFGPGWTIQRTGWAALLRAAPEMNSLVAIGTLAAWGYSVVATIAPALLPANERHVYFEAATVIVALVLLGRWLEARARHSAAAAIRGLLDLQPATATVEREGVAVTIEAAALATGDVVRIRPGERLPADGLVVEGGSFVDEAMLTGEAAPVRKEAGSAVVGGTVNGAGALRVRLTAVSEGTMLARIVRLVEEAQGGKLPIQALVDRVTRWFVPAVLLAAVVTFAGWLAAGAGSGMALVAGVSVLIIACPCALGLATPVAILVGSGRGAELGVLFRRGAALQALSAVTVVAFDKTGTLTAGRPALTELRPAAGFNGDDVLALAAAVEAWSEHPVASAIVVGARTRGLDVSSATGFEARPGQGVAGRVSGRDVAVGSASFLRSRGVDPAPFAAMADAAADAAATPIFVAVDGTLAGLLVVGDPVRPTTPAALEALRALGLSLAMVSGDTPRTARAVAGPLGIGTVVAGVLPEGKVAALRGLGDEARVAFVGDGINDAPALAAAAVGIAVGSGTDIAIDSADVVLLAGDLRGVATAVGLARATLRNIRQNLAWAFGYNSALIPAAALGWLSPMLAAAAMALSSLCVIGNALRLRGYRPTG